MIQNPKKRHPAQLELLILKVLWQAETDEVPMPVRTIRSELASLGRELAHTSVITTLNVMVEKKFLKKSKRKNAFLFAPAVQQHQVNSRVIDDVLNRVFDGSAQSLMLTLLNHKNVEAVDLKAIRKLINRKSRELSE